ncbi:EIN3-binding F-box protein 1 isoform X2 [Gastrolobium bilobum]|uniref:EIN3-binding F-box protein 1 isoform X2 n=1 Tax=Gastrolobium bilobum TaxID=150636 RepID=UPI002AB195E8|nr:EIN3-binding F-box protein 1 isoform X2 [Gastrolobium bilobum]
MSKVFGFSGDDFCPGGSIYSNPKEASFFLSLGHEVDVYFPPRKRSRISAPIVFNGEWFEQMQKTSIEALPDECLFEIFRRLPVGKERSACASVSKRWLMLLSNICKNEICSNKNTLLEESEKEGDDEEFGGEGYLSRSLEGKKATDVRLAAIAVGTASRGGLGKLSIRGSNMDRGVTTLGLKAVAHGCPSLKALSLWNVATIGDEGLIEIANGCQKLEKLDLCKCSSISDKALVAVAKNCPNLTELSLESCPNIGNEGLQAIGKFCSNLRSISIKDCAGVGDQGIAGLFSSTSLVLTKVKLQALTVSDLSLAVIGHYGKTVTDLVLNFLPNVSERGFWVMGNSNGLQKLKSLTIASCRGVTDIGLEAVGKGCPNLKSVHLHKCAFLSDNGLISFTKAASSLESLQLEECHRITQCGFFGVLFNCGTKLKALSLVSCYGINDLNLVLSPVSPCESLRSLSIRNCPGFGNGTLSVLGKLCPQIQHIELSGLDGVTDAGFLPLVESSEAGLVKVNLSGCINLTDKVVSSLVNLHGWTLENLNLDGCKNIGDASLMAIAENCSLLCDLDVSKCAITDAGIAALAQAKQLNLQILSLSGCTSVSDRSLPALRKLGHTLLGLNIKHCNAISSSTVDMLVELLWRCDILS